MTREIRRVGDIETGPSAVLSIPILEGHDEHLLPRV
jgi:hypothetical protein